MTPDSKQDYAGAHDKTVDDIEALRRKEDPTWIAALDRVVANHDEADGGKESSSSLDAEPKSKKNKEVEALPKEEKGNSRAERKRERERQRREDVNRQFEDLVSTMQQIRKDIDSFASLDEPPPEGESTAAQSLGKKRKKRFKQFFDSCPSSQNRANVISKAVFVLSELNQERDEQRKSMRQLKTQISDAKSSLNTNSSTSSAGHHPPMMMMMPMMVPAPPPTTNTNTAPGYYPHFPSHAPMPHHPPPPSSSTWPVPPYYYPHHPPGPHPSTIPIHQHAYHPGQPPLHPPQPQQQNSNYTNNEGNNASSSTNNNSSESTTGNLAHCA